ncbi:Hypothetical predicted protein, partial [Marmota monax]
MRPSKADVERYIASVQGSAPARREKSMKGFYFAKLYYEAKEYDLAKKYISTYINVQERDPKAHRFGGLLYEAEENTDKAVECYKRSVELNPTQKDLVLKIAELLCKNDVTDGRAKYWIERATELFPGSPAIYKLKEQLLDCKGEDGWNKLFDLIQSELYTRPDDVHVNIRLVELYRSNKRLKDAVAHCHEAERNIALRSSLDWNLCVVQTLTEYLESLHVWNLIKMTAFHVLRPKIKLIKGENGQNLLEMMAHDHLSQSGHMLLNLSHGKQDILKEVVESFANKSGQSALYDALFSSQSPKERSFLGSDDIGNIDVQAPEPGDLARYDV